MAILKHIASKSSNYGAALEYLIFKHDELRKKPILDKNGNRIMRDEFYLDGLNCEPYSFDAACQQLNREYQKNKNKDEIKSHHYIISFDPADKDECGLTGERAQAIGLEYTIAQNCTPNQINKNNLRLNKINRTKEAYGRYQNVFLENYSELKIEIAELDVLIEDLSAYMQSTGKKYADHAATLRSWSARKKKQQKPGTGIPDYTYSKEESL